jgi:hypothetical protein
MNSRTTRTLVAAATVAGALAAGTAGALAAEPTTTASAPTTPTTTTIATTPPASHPNDSDRVTVEPTTVAAGGTVAVHGTGCARSVGDTGNVIVWLTSEGGPVTDAAEATVQADGNWAVRLTVPARLSPETYPVSARCRIGGGSFFYDGVDLQVTAAPAAPGKPQTPRAVPAKPRFTG